MSGCEELCRQFHRRPVHLHFFIAVELILSEIAAGVSDHQRADHMLVYGSDDNCYRHHCQLVKTQASWLTVRSTDCEISL
jgi:hypothetical protein